MQNAILPPSANDDTVAVVAVSTVQLADRVKQLGDGAEDWVALNGFNAAEGMLCLVPSTQGRKAVLLLGLGDTEPNAMHLGASVARNAPVATYELESGIEDAVSFALGFALASYRFSSYQQNKKSASQLKVSEGSVQEALAPILSGVQIARDLINAPANDMGPAELADEAKVLFTNHGGSIEVTEGKQLEEGFPLIHAVGKASDRAPRLIDARWGDESHPKVTLVGKGVVFDSGGLNIKPANGMLLMKKDMGGAANVLGLAAMIMAAKLPIRLRVLIPAVENAISGSSFRPSDVLRSRKGLTVEVGNTDAEGRLVLADALTYADDEKPELLIDMATLTGAARVALGPDLPPYYTDDEELAETIAVHSEAVQDPLWRMPLWKPYREYIGSKTADICNMNTIGSGFAGSMTAALFLQEFVENSESWVHFDIYGWTPMEKDIKPQGGEAQGIRALFDMLQARFSQ
ncbi:leucyl aminopeptidase family protein [Pseudovibrio exalbescens]|uniref:leucyl aminopeptidase family protein n=1 Tax=Pseudovibrio exalbescens TaxID=197461 RepID=UPI00236653DB|nr:leucyl aminopeptidase family protein [Pseudovibrio exalbescens]MDD7910096.1 leucyl aminopeptidase family protein [Pseudovibrio exalbescens]